MASRNPFTFEDLGKTVEITYTEGDWMGNKAGPFVAAGKLASYSVSLRGLQFRLEGDEHWRTGYVTDVRRA